MKKILILILSFIPICMLAQNTMHTAFDTNGKPGEFLFPSDNEGNVTMTEKVDVADAKAEQIQNALVSFINSYAMKHEVDIRDKSISNGSLIYKLQYPVGKESFQVNVLGAPVFAYNRDASKVDFMLEIQVRDNAFKYKLSEFWTSRRMIRGEGKNNGPSNLIHWQRVNSLTKERDAYIAENKMEKRETKEKVYDYNQQIKYEGIQYQKEYQAVNDFVQALKNVNISDDFDDFDTPQKNISKVEKKQVTPLDLSSYKGNLLKKGNKVCILPATTKNYDMAGAYELLKQVTIDEHWTIANTPEEAHFILEYKVNLEGRDQAELIIKDNFGHSVSAGKCSAGESTSDNKEAAKSLYIKSVLPIIKQMEKGKTPKTIAVFERN